MIPVSLGLSGSSENTLVANRGNVITLNLVSPACNPTGTLGTTGTAAKVEALAKANAAVRKSGFTFLSEPLTPGRVRGFFPPGGTNVVPPMQPSPQK